MFYIVLFLASATDVLANTFETSLNLVLWTLRIMLFVLPLVAGVVTYLLLREMAQIPSIGEPKIPVEIRRGIDGSFAFAELSVHESGEEILELPEEVAYRSLLSGDGHMSSEDDESVGGEAIDHPDESPHGVFEVPRD
jgi:ubiquinol-cytochrome c reductase cytochrome b subunit